MPPLPKFNKTREAAFGLKFREWLKTSNMYSGTFELKDTRGKETFPFKELKEEQAAHALACKSNMGNLIRIQAGTNGAPDYVYFRNARAWVVINYPKGFVVIDIKTFLAEKERSKVMSLSWSRAKAISYVTV